MVQRGLAPRETTYMMRYSRKIMSYLISTVGMGLTLGGKSIKPQDFRAQNLYRAGILLIRPESKRKEIRIKRHGSPHFEVAL